MCLEVPCVLKVKLVTILHMCARYAYIVHLCVITDTTRPPKSSEDNDNFNFVSEEHMRREIMAHKFIEFGKYQQHLYGIKSESVLDIIRSGKMCILDVHPQVITLKCV